MIGRAGSEADDTAGGPEPDEVIVVERPWRVATRPRQAAVAKDQQETARVGGVAYDRDDLGDGLLVEIGEVDDRRRAPRTVAGQVQEPCQKISAQIAESAIVAGFGRSRQDVLRTLGDAKDACSACEQHRETIEIGRAADEGVEARDSEHAPAQAVGGLAEKSDDILGADQEPAGEFGFIPGDDLNDRPPGVGLTGPIVASAGARQNGRGRSQHVAVELVQPGG